MRIQQFGSRIALACLVAALFPLTAPAMPEAASTAAAAQTPSISGEDHVSAQGQVTQSYAFALPQARLMPSLSLSYSSGAGDSDVGYGWTLVAASKISRDLRREDPVLDVQDDHYVADGVSLLRRPGEFSTPLRFERWGDATHTEYEFDSTNNTWTEHTHTGLVRRYQPLVMQESTQDGPAPLRRRFGSKVQADRSAADRTIEWALTEEEDQFGNQVSYAYEKAVFNATYSGIPNEPTLIEIRYGGNVRLGTQPMFVVSIGRYLHPAPRQLQDVKPDHALQGPCPQHSLIAQGFLKHRFGGPFIGPEGQGIWGIGVSVGNGASTDPSVFALPGALSTYWRLNHSHARIGCMNANELHDNLEKIEPFGRDPNSGAMTPGVATTYEYYGWDRQWAAIPQTLPSGVAQPFLGNSALMRQTPTEPSVMASESYSSGLAGGYLGHWPATQADCSSGECVYFDIAGAASTVQMLSDQNGDGIPDYVDFFSAQSCNRAVSGLIPTFAAGHGDGSFSAATQPLSWAAAVMNPWTGTASPMPAFCGAELWRSTLGTAYPVSATAGSSGQRVPFLAITGNESFQVDTDGDGYADTMRLIGNQRLYHEMLIDPPAGDADFQWRIYHRNPADLSTEAPRTLVNTPWSIGIGGIGAMVLKAPQQNVSATVRNIDSVGIGYGFDWSSTELGSLADITGDNIPDRIAAMKVGYLANQPFPYHDTNHPEHTIPEQYALTVYRGKLVPDAMGRLELQFNESPEFWWTRAEGGEGLGAELDEERLAPATSASIHNRCYGRGAAGCFDSEMNISQIVDLNGDGLPDIVTTPAKLHANFRYTELRGGGSYQLEPMTALYNTGHGLTRFLIGLSTPPELGGLPSYLSNTVIDNDPAGFDLDLVDSGHHFVHNERVLEQFVDFNGDGFPDMVQPHGVRIGGNGQLSAPLSVTVPPPSMLPNGLMESSRVVRWMAPSGIPGGANEWQEIREQTTQMIDMNGDGRPDWMVLNPTTRQTTLITDADLSIKPGALKTVKDGLGGSTEYKYQTIAHALSTDARGVPSKGFVVESIRHTRGTSSASGPVQETKIAFSQGYFGRHSEGRDDGQLAVNAAGFLGFGVVTTTLPTGQRIVERYDSAFGHEGLLLGQDVFAAGGQLLERTTHTYVDVAAHNRSWNGQMIQPADVHLPLSVVTETWHESASGGYDPIPMRSALNYVYRGYPLANFGAPSEIVNEGDSGDPRDDTKMVMGYQSGGFNDGRGQFYTFVQTDSRTFGYDEESGGTLTKLLAHTRNDYDCDPDSLGGYGCPSALPGATVTQGLLRQSVVFFDISAPDDDSRALRTRYYYDSRDGVLTHVADAAGRVTGYCYDPHHLQVVLVRQPDGRRTESVIDLANGIVVERRGPVNLSPLPLAGGPTHPMNATACPAVDTGMPGFGGMPASIPMVAQSQSINTPIVPLADQPTPAPTAVTVPGGDGTAPTASNPKIPYSYSNDPITAALRDRRQVPPGLDRNAALRLSWDLVGINYSFTALSGAWVPAAMPIDGRRPNTPTVHIQSDGLGRAIRTLATTQRDSDGSYTFTQLDQNAQWFSDGASGEPAGIFHLTETLVSGDSYSAADAKKHWRVTWVDGAGQTLWTENRTTATDAPQQFANYGMEGLPNQVLSPDPQNPAAYVSAAWSSFDDRNQPRTISLSAGRTLRHEVNFAWRTDGPHFVSRVYRGLDGAAATRVGETEAIPRQRTLIQRSFVNEGSDDAMVTKVVLDELGRTRYASNPEGQVTRYDYDLAGRPTLIARYNNELDRVSAHPIETTQIVYPDYADRTSPTEDTHSIGTYFAADGSTTTSDEVIQVDRSTGKVVRTIKQPSSDASLIGYGGTNLTYVTNSALDGYGEVETESNPNETKTFTYNAQQRIASTTMDTVVRWPGTATTLVDRLVYNAEYEPSGKVRRTIIDTDGSSAGRLATRYEYDEAGHLSKIWDETHPSTTPVDAYDYTPLGQLWQRLDSRRGTKTLSYDHYGLIKELSISAPEWTMPYTQTIGRDDQTGLPISIMTTRPDGASLSAGYKYNLAGQLTTATESGYVGSVTYRCNAGLCDERVDTLNEVIPGAGQRHVRYQYAEPYDVTQLTDQLNLKDLYPIRHYSYDAPGALTGDGTHTYGNDPLGHLYTNNGGGYAYDANDNQTIQYVRAAGSTAPSAAYSAMPGLEIEYRLDASGRLARQALRRHVGEQRTAVMGAADEALIESDVLGNTAIVRHSGSTAYANYTPFGQLIQSRSSGFGNEWFGYKGGRIDQTGTGLVRFGARSYDPASGRWISRDPIRNRLFNTDAYGAFGSNPIVNDDPDGLQVMPGSAGAGVKPGAGEQDAYKDRLLARRYYDLTGDTTLRRFDLYRATGRTDIGSPILSSPTSIGADSGGPGAPVISGSSGPQLSPHDPEYAVRENPVVQAAATTIVASEGGAALAARAGFPVVAQVLRQTAVRALQIGAAAMGAGPVATPSRGTRSPGRLLIRTGVRAGGGGGGSGSLPPSGGGASGGAPRYTVEDFFPPIPENLPLAERQRIIRDQYRHFYATVDALYDSPALTPEDQERIGNMYFEHQGRFSDIATDAELRGDIDGHPGVALFHACAGSTCGVGTSTAPNATVGTPVERSMIGRLWEHFGRILNTYSPP